MKTVKNGIEERENIPKGALLYISADVCVRRVNAGAMKIKDFTRVCPCDFVYPNMV